VSAHSREASTAMDGGSLTTLYGNPSEAITSSGMCPAWWPKLDIHCKKIDRNVPAASGADPRRVSGGKEIPSAAGINLAAGFCQHHAPRLSPVDVITINTPDTPEKYVLWWTRMRRERGRNSGGPPPTSEKYSVIATRNCRQRIIADENENGR